MDDLKLTKERLKDFEEKSRREEKTNRS